MIALNEAAVARLTTAGAQRVYMLGEVPKLPVMPYAVVSADAGTPGNYLNSAQHGTRSFRINVQCVGSTYRECARTAERADSAFLDQVLTELDATASPCSRDIDTPPARDPDAGGVIYALMSYVFTGSI